MIRKILMGIFIITFYFIFRDLFKAKKKAVEILGKPTKYPGQIKPKKKVVEINFKEIKQNQDENGSRTSHTP